MSVVAITRCPNYYYNNNIITCDNYCTLWWGSGRLRLIAKLKSCSHMIALYHTHALRTGRARAYSYSYIGVRSCSCTFWHFHPYFIPHLHLLYTIIMTSCIYKSIDSCMLLRECRDLNVFCAKLKIILLLANNEQRTHFRELEKKRLCNIRMTAMLGGGGAK